MSTTKQPDTTTAAEPAKQASQAAPDTRPVRVRFKATTLVGRVWIARDTIDTLPNDQAIALEQMGKVVVIGIA